MIYRHSVCLFMSYINCNELNRTPIKLQALKYTEMLAGYKLTKKGHQANLVTMKTKLIDGFQKAIKSRCKDEDFRHTLIASLSNWPLDNLAESIS